MAAAGRIGTVAILAGLGLAAMPSAPSVAADIPLSPPVPAPELMAPVPLADPVWAVTGFLGASGGGSDLHVLAYKPWHAEPSDYLFAGAAVSRRLARFWTDFAIEAEVGAGHRFGSGYRASEGWVAGYVRYDGFPWNHFVRTSVAFSTGIDVITRLPGEETRPVDRHRSHLLHYFSPELTFALPEAPNHELVARWHHRSGVFGLFDGVKGGSNVVALGYRYRW